jgi:thiazole synthase
MHDTLTIAGREFGSRLLLGTGKYDAFETMRDAVVASGTQIVTVAVRRIDFDAPGEDITSFLPEEVLLLPNTSGCETEDGFTVLPYILPDPVLAKKLEEVGCATVMPLAAPIGSGRGLKLRDSIRIIVEQAGVPVVVDAGLGAPSHAAESMEMGADAVLVNTAVARAEDPIAMAGAFRLAVEAGRTAFHAGVMEEQAPTPSSPIGGTV